VPVRIHDALAGAALLIAARRHTAASMGREQEETLWRYLRALSGFVHVTGQVYLLEDARREAEHSVSEWLNAYPGTFARQALELLHEEQRVVPDAERECLSVLMALVGFLAGTRQLAEAEDFFRSQDDHAPVAIAHFPNREAAEAWLEGCEEPPSPARILIGDAYHQVWYSREEGTRGLYRDPVVEPVMEALVAQGFPERTPSFATRAEAEAWLKHHPANPYAFVSIAGERHFAVHHRRLKRHSLQAVASALDAWEEHKRAVEREAAQEAFTEGKGSTE
jgi:hypothetical protein